MSAWAKFTLPLPNARLLLALDSTATLESKEKTSAPVRQHLCEPAHAAARL